MLRRWAAPPRGIRWLSVTATAALAPTVVFGIALVLLVPVADLLARQDVGSATGHLHESALDNARGRLLTLAAGALAFTARTFTSPARGK
jgi:hypothetical protein